MRHSVSTYFIGNYMMFLGYWWTMHKPYVAVVVKIYLYKIKLCSKSYICSCTHCTTNMMMHFLKKKRIESQIISQCNKNEKKNSVINNVGMRGCKIKLVVVSFLNCKKPLEFSLWYISLVQFPLKIATFLDFTLGLRPNNETTVSLSKQTNRTTCRYKKLHT